MIKPAAVQTLWLAVVLCPECRASTLESAGLKQHVEGEGLLISVRREVATHSVAVDGRLLPQQALQGDNLSVSSENRLEESSTHLRRELVGKRRQRRARHRLFRRCEAAVWLRANVFRPRPKIPVDFR